MISEERLEKALRMLATTDEEFAASKAAMLRQEYIADLVRKRKFLEADGNNEERKAKAEDAEQTIDAMGEYFERVSSYEQLKAKRATEELIVEVWRSLEASRRQGRI